MNKVELSAIERKVLNSIQEDIPLNSKPFSCLAKGLGIKERDLINCVKGLKEKGIIRRFSARIDHRKLGFKSSLIALRIPVNKVNLIAQEIALIPEVTHCYERKAEFNLWLVYIGENGKYLKDFINSLSKKVGKENILSLPTKKQFKLKNIIRF